MKEANFLDLYTHDQLIIFIILVLAGVVFLCLGRIFIKKRKPFFGSFSLLLSVIQVLLILIDWHKTFPVIGAIYCPKYLEDWVLVNSIREDLESFKKSCKRYPNTEEGLDALLEGAKLKNCTNFKPRMRFFTINSYDLELEYESDGDSYRISSFEKGINIYIVATDKAEAKYFKK